MPLPKADEPQTDDCEVLVIIPAVGFWKGGEGCANHYDQGAGNARRPTPVKDHFLVWLAAAACLSYYVQLCGAACACSACAGNQ